MKNGNHFSSSENKINVFSAPPLVAKRYAPVALFVYNRPLHTEKVIKALLECEEAQNTDLIIFSDAPKMHADEEAVLQVRNYLATISGFHSIAIVNRKTNYGLALNIIDGVSKVVNDYGKIIVLEDDILVEKCFLSFMNKCLITYEENKEIFSIGACTYAPIKRNRLVPYCQPTCWGWGTWKDQWDLYEKYPDKAYCELADINFRKRLNSNNLLEIAGQIDSNYKGTANTWACFLNYTSIKHKKINVYPPHSIITNIGQDGSGSHKIVDASPKGAGIEMNELYFPDITELLMDHEAEVLIEDFLRLSTRQAQVANEIEKKTTRLARLKKILLGKV